MADPFFDEQEEQSGVKAELVVNYFAAWSQIMVSRADRIGYFDFFAGPGRYGSGEMSTPLLILQRAVDSPDLSERLVSVFNDANPEYTGNLAREFEKLAGIERLKHRPQIITGELSDELVEQFEEINMIPALSFIDPWGYKGLSLRLIHAVLKDWGCEVIFFFNYNRINMGITNWKVEPHMQALFGEERLERLQAEVQSIDDPDQREQVVKRRLGDALEAMGARYLIPFTFRRDGGRVSHYICFASKHPLGYSIMKNIMANRGIKDEDGVPLFEYLPSSGGRQVSFDRARPILALPDHLLDTFAGQTLTVQQIFDVHNVGTPFIKSNYKSVLRDMEDAALITCEPDRESRRANTMADRVLVSFPPRRR